MAKRAPWARGPMLPPSMVLNYRAVDCEPDARARLRKIRRKLEGRDGRLRAKGERLAQELGLMTWRCGRCGLCPLAEEIEPPRALLVRRLEAIVDRGIVLLDRLQGDPDFEPDLDREASLGWAARGDAPAPAAWLTAGGLGTDCED